MSLLLLLLSLLLFCLLYYPSASSHPVRPSNLLKEDVIVQLSMD
jgi:hypothetical protein